MVLIKPLKAFPVRGGVSYFICSNPRAARGGTVDVCVFLTQCPGSVTGAELPSLDVRSQSRSYQRLPNKKAVGSNAYENHELTRIGNMIS